MPGAIFQRDVTGKWEVHSVFFTTGLFRHLNNPASAQNHLCETGGCERFQDYSLVLNLLLYYYVHDCPENIQKLTGDEVSDKK